HVASTNALQVSQPPETEIELWRHRNRELVCILALLTSRKAQQMLDKLRICGSSYLKPLDQMTAIVQNAVIEAQEMCSFLKPFEVIFKKLEKAEFRKISIYFAPLFHLLALSWSKSQYFRSPPRLVVLLQKISFALI
uniref:DHC_N1 domain-containing protein n=1 Tax=Mesocestoides corti TaxID=53468 RepID=A0A5K3EIP9_MESCO